MAEQYRIGEFADLAGISPKTLRFYDEIGLLRPASIDPRTRYRFYLPQQLPQLAAILALKDVGISLADARKLTGKSGAKDERRQVLRDLKRSVEQSIHAASQSLQWINAALKELEDSDRPIPVVVKRRPALLIASVRSKVETYAQIERYEQQLLAELPAHSLGSVRGVLWHRCADSGSLEGEPFFTLKHRLPARTMYEQKQLPAATLACAYSASDDHSAEHAYRAINRWIMTRGYRLAGPKREIYLNQLLEIQFPIKTA